MRPPSGDNESLLHHAMDELQHRFQATSSTWRDETRVEFEKQYIYEIERSCTNAQRSMRAITDLLRHVVKECS